MKKKISFGFIIAFLSVTAPIVYGQEEPELDVEQSAEVFLEEYSDDFQENFFEALKQKGIENYDKAVNLLLKCKQLDETNKVVDHELAKAYYADKKFNLGEGYAITALNAQPDNPWYLETLVDILQKQGNTIDVVRARIPYENTKLKENLALTYFKKNQYEEALKVLQEVQQSAFAEDLAVKINDSLDKRKAQAVSSSFSVENSNAGVANPMQGYQMRLEGLLRTNSDALLLQVSEEALETYPSQPFFYYAQGYALNKAKRHKEAIEVLETGLDYLVNDIPLENKFYTELAAAYTGTYNTVKANMYLSKIKPGF